MEGSLSQSFLAVLQRISYWVIGEQELGGVQAILVWEQPKAPILRGDMAAGTVLHMVGHGLQQACSYVVGHSVGQHPPAAW